MYIENEARLVYVALSLEGNTPIAPTVLREITQHRPDIIKRLRDTRVVGTHSVPSVIEARPHANESR